MQGTSTEPAARFNPYQPGFAADPYAQYRALREHDPVHRSFMGIWVLTRYDQVSGVLRDPGFSSELRRWDGFQRRYRRKEPVDWLLSRTVLNVDPPLHTELKRSLSRAFGPQLRGTLTQALGAIVAEQVERLRAAGPRVDAIEHFAVPVPVRAVAHVYQLSAAELPTVKRWSNGVSGLIEPLPSLAALEDAERSILEFKAYLEARLQGPPCPASLPGRVACELEAGSIDLEAALANLILLFPAGHETTVNLIGNGLLALLRHPDQARRLREDPRLLDRAVEEVLRYEPPQQVAWRVATEDREIGGKMIRSGEQVMALLGAANRDPEAFADPERFDAGRTPNPHLSFGSGRHGCLGAWFARLQGKLALSAFLAAFPEARLAGEPEWHSTLSFHGLRSLPVALA